MKVNSIKNEAVSKGTSLVSLPNIILLNGVYVRGTFEVPRTWCPNRNNILNKKRAAAF